MKNLSFEKLPHYFFSANRQFEENECHMTRIYGLSVLLLVRKGVLRFTENDVPAEVGAGEYYIQKPNLYQRGPRPSDAPNYYFIHFMGHYSNGGALPVRGKFNIDHIQPIIQELEALDNSAEKIEYECLFYKLLMTLKNDLDEKPRAEKMRTFPAGELHAADPSGRPVQNFTALQKPDDQRIQGDLRHHAAPIPDQLPHPQSERTHPRHRPSPAGDLLSGRFYGIFKFFQAVFRRLRADPLRLP